MFPLVKFSISSLCFKTRKWCHGSRPSSSFHLRRGRGHTELDKGKKQGRAHRRVGQWVCSLTLIVPGDEYKRNLPSWCVSQHGYGCPGFSSWEYGAAEDLWLLWVWQLGENRLRWIWTSVQSAARTVENMAGYQMPSLPSYGWQVSYNCWVTWVIFD